MKIVMLYFGLVNRPGIGSYTIQLCRFLNKFVELYLLIPYKRETAKQLKMVDLPIYYFETPKNLRNLLNLVSLVKIIKQINRIKPDIIHIQSGHLWFSLALPYIYKKYPIVLTLHDARLHQGEEKLRWRIMQYIFKKYATRIIVHGEQQKLLLNKLYNIPKEKIFVTYIGSLLIDKPSINNDKEKKNMVLFHGRIHKYKGLENLIRAEPIIKKEIPELKIVIAGRCTNFKYYQEMMINHDTYIIYN